MTTPRISEGINLRAEAAKIDVKQFDANDVNHVVPIIAVMRPPKGLKDQPSISVNKSMPTPGSPPPARGENVLAEDQQKLTNDQKKEAERQIDRYHRAWKRLRPDETPEQSPERGDDEEEEKEASGLPSIPRRPVTQGQSNRPFAIAQRAGNSLSKSARRVDPSSRGGGERGTQGVSTEAFTNKFR